MSSDLDITDTKKAIEDILNKDHLMILMVKLSRDYEIEQAVIRGFLR